MTLSEQIRREARALGFDAIGMARVREEECQQLHARLLDWLGRGYHGLMTWMGRDAARRANPGRVLPGCRTVISVGLNYYSGQQPDERPGYGRVARYAWGQDYHRVLTPRLEGLADRIRQLAPHTATRCYVDTGPIMEKAWAQRAGLGWVGKHSNLVSETFGSWLLLGEILTTLELDPDAPGQDLCGSCTLCIRACPTGAITEPYVVDARRCIAYLTIELPRTGHDIPAELQGKIGNRIFGCDDCLDICPYNVNATVTTEAAFHATPPALSADLHELSHLTEDAFGRLFRTSPVRRARYAGFLRTLRLALRNVVGQVGDRPPTLFR